MQVYLIALHKAKMGSQKIVLKILLQKLLCNILYILVVQYLNSQLPNTSNI